MEPSNRQQAIVDTWVNDNCNIVISAVAGSGKTSTLLLLLEKCQHRTLFVAFNKAIQEETQQKIEQRGLNQGKSMTMHSIGLSAIRHSKKRFRVNNNKNWVLIKELQNRRRQLFRGMDSSEKTRIAFNLIDINDASRTYLTDDLIEIQKHLLSMDKVISITDPLREMWKEFIDIREEAYEEDTIEIDFTDMIYYPVKMNLEIPIYATYLMVDEAQDLSICQHKLVDKLLSQGTIEKFIAVGDRNQAIYGFSGALSNSFDNFLHKETENPTVEMPLDICYRCDRKIIESANQVYNVMVAASTEDGIVGTTSNVDTIENNSMVICRNTGPLIKLYFKLLALDKPCYINGNEIMNNLMKFLKQFEKHTIYSASIEMSYKLQELAEGETAESKFKFRIFNENYENFIILAQHMTEQMDSISSLMEKLKILFDDKGSAIMLCTIHKSKGLQSNTVYILNEDLIPSKYAKSPEQLTQEKNLKYVGRTRAIHSMYFLNLKD